jgi:hypothetical protein
MCGMYWASTCSYAFCDLYETREYSAMRHKRRVRLKTCVDVAGMRKTEDCWEALQISTSNAHC